MAAVLTAGIDLGRVLDELLAPPSPARLAA
jgi:hypothetical protein